MVIKNPAVWEKRRNIWESRSSLRDPQAGNVPVDAPPGQPACLHHHRDVDSICPGSVQSTRLPRRELGVQSVV
ncbi:UNVERIFIED_CONTAM: hypothetical protein FKN15_051029 [Acipenser sinensis]